MPRLAVCALLALAVLLTPVHAATIVAPPEFDGVDGTGLIFGPLQDGPITFQWLIAASNLSALAPGDYLGSIGFRIHSGYPAAPSFGGTYATWNLTLSPSLNPIGALDTSFAANIGPGAVLVRSGPLTVDAASFAASSSTPPFTFISFSTPYAYSGGDLLLTLTHTGTTGTGFGNDAFFNPATTDAVLHNSFNATSGSAHFFNVPITAFETTDAPLPVPEPASSLLAAAGCAALLLLRRSR